MKTNNILWEIIIPTVLIIIGKSFIMKDIFQSRNDNKKYFSIFSKQDVTLNNEEFISCSLSEIIGEV